jgi:hypothetical protein
MADLSGFPLYGPSPERNAILRWRMNPVAAIYSASLGLKRVLQRTFSGCRAYDISLNVRRKRRQAVGDGESEAG